MEPAGSESPARPVWYAGPDSALGELWTMLHLPYTLMVLSFVVVGAAVSPSISWMLLGGTLLAYFLGLGIGAHFLDQIPGMGSRYIRHWPDWGLWLGGFLALGGAVAIGVVGALRFVGPPLLLLVGVQSICAIGYPLAKWFGGVLHRDSVFAIAWGGLPFLTSYYAQSGAINLQSVVVAAALGVVAVAEIRLSRASRSLRAEARHSLSPRHAFQHFDRALKALSVATILVALSLFTSRVVLAIW